MALSINTNVISLNAQRNLSQSQNALAKSMRRLSSGLRINSAQDAAAGLAITDRMTAQIRGLNQAARNASDGISLAQTAEGALQESTNLLQRMRELAVQSANDTNSQSDRDSLQAEVTQLKEELNRIAETAQFNGKSLLNGGMSGTGNQATFQIGANAGASQTINFGINSAKTADLSAVGTTINSPNNLVGGNVVGAALNAGDLKVNGVDVGANDGTAAGLAAAINTAAGSNIASAVNVQKLDFADVTLDGTSNQTETAIFTFADLSAGESLTIDGRTVTATGGTLLADDVAAAFANGGDASGPGITAGNATISGNLANYAASASGADVAFTSTTANSNVADLTASSVGVAPTAPAANVTQQGGAGSNAQTVYEFATVSASGSNQTIEIDDRIVTIADGTTATADDIAEAFATGQTVGNAVFSGSTTTGQWSAVQGTGTESNRVTFTGEITGLFFPAVMTSGGVAAPVKISQQQDIAAATEEATVAFSDLMAGQSLTIDGRTVTATGGTLLADDVAAAFANGGDASGSDITTGNATISGNLANYTAGAPSGANLTFTSTIANTNVADLIAIAGGVSAPTAPTATVTQGSAAAVTGTYTLTFDGSATVNVAASAGKTAINAQDVVDAINDTTNGAAGYTAALTGDGQVQITKVDGSNFTLTEAIDVDGPGAGAVAVDGAGLADVGSGATTFQGQISLSSTSGVSFTGNLAAAGLSNVGNATTTIDQVDVSDREKAVTVISSIDAALKQIGEMRGALGAVQNRFESTIVNLHNVSENLSAARSRILDADIAQETSAMTKQNILQQAGVSILAQANQAPQLALSLLR